MDTSIIFKLINIFVTYYKPNEMLANEYPDDTYRLYLSNEL